MSKVFEHIRSGISNPGLASDPSDPQNGDLYYNTTSNVFRQYINGSWSNVGTSSTSGTVTSVSVVSANGLAGTVATSTTTPAITLSTTITGILQGNGTAISAATTTGSGSVVLATSPTFVTGITTPLVIGGTTASSTLTLESTSGAGTTDSILFKTGSQTTALTISTAQKSTFNGNVAFTTTSTQGIVGTTTNDSAAAGNVGESFRSFTGGPGATLTSGSFKSPDTSGIALTAGDWDIDAVGCFASTASTTAVTLLAIAISTVVNSNTGATAGDSQVSFPYPTASLNVQDVCMSIPAFRVSLSGSQTYFLSVRADFTGSGVTGYGRISARRVR